jgi:hypothetical protein
MSNLNERAAFDRFTADLATCLKLDVEKAARLAEILDDRMTALADKSSSEALDREFHRGDWSDY